jgi:NAD+ kinase
MGIRAIGVVGNANKGHVVDNIARLSDWAGGKGLEVLLEKEAAGKLGARGYHGDELGSRADLVVTMGGDGTLLQAARIMRRSNVPILGVNMGTFGYLTVINLNEMFDALESVLAGDYRTERRMMLDVSVRDERGESFECCVLNDVVINRGNYSRLVDLETHVDGHYLTTYRADGLIISTPTGSTAYSLSAGGPIVLPVLNTILLNPICPHTLTNRPVILPDKALLKVMLWTREAGAIMSCDGQVTYNLKPGDVIDVRKSDCVTNLIVSPRRDYLQILRSKLGWGGSPTSTNRT